MIKHIIFDVDKTIYPESCGFGDEMDRRISQYTATYIDIPLEDADILRRESFKKYGTTLKWLQTEHGLTDTEHFLDKVHPKNVDQYLPNKNKVRRIFNDISIPMSILSNGPIENIDRILNFYEIKALFHPIVDIKMNNLLGKPNRVAYEYILKQIDCPINQILFVDDVEEYLAPFKNMGGQVLLINETNKTTALGFDQINNILDLPDYLKTVTNIVK